MNTFLLVVLVILVSVPLAVTMKNPVRIFEYPYFMAFAFAAFIVPQAVVLIRFPGFVEDDSVAAMLMMCCLCVGSCFVGYSLAPSATMLNLTSKPLDLNRLFRVGILFTVAAYAMGILESVTVAQYAVDTGGLTGIDTILMFFQLLAYPGFAILFICALRRPCFSTVAMCIIGAWSPLGGVIIGRRENSTILVLTIVMALFYERRVKPKRSAIVGSLIFATLAIPATTEYREYANSKNWSGVQQMDLLANFQKFASEGSILELRNGAAIIEATREIGDYQLGRGYWNNLVFRYIPAQFLGKDFKNSLMFDVFDVGKTGGSETGIMFSRGSTITGMADTFMQFGWFGCLFFAFMGVLFKGMWAASLAPDAHFARLMYIMTITSGMRAVTHWTADFLPGLIFFGIFLGAAGIYAGVPRNRLAPGVAFARR